MRAGVREIEVSSFVPPKLLPQLADAEAVVRHALALPGLTVSALIPNLKGAERGLALGVHEMNFVLSVSEGHNRSNVRRSTAESIEDFRRVVALCHTAPAGPAPAGGVRARHRLRLHDRRRGRRGPGAPDRRRGRRGRRRRDHPRRHGRLRPAGCGRAGLPPGDGRCRAAPGVRAFPRHPRARPRQCAGGAQRRGARFRRVLGRARRLPLRARAPPATS